MDDLLKQVLGIGKKIKDTILTTSPISFADDKLSAVVQNKFNNLGQSVSKKIKPTVSPLPDVGYNKIINPIRRAAGETAKTVISEIPEITKSIAKLTPAGQLGQSARNVIERPDPKKNAQNQLADLYNALKGVGYVTAPAASAVGGVASVGIQGLINKTKGEKFFNNADKSFAEGFSKSAPMSPIAALNPIAKAVTAGRYTGLPSQYSFIQRMGAAAARNAAEGAALGLIEPDVADRLKNVKDQIILGAVTGGLMQAGGDVGSLAAGKIAKALGIAKKEVQAWIKHAKTTVNYTNQQGKEVSEPLWRYVLKDQTGAIDFAGEVEIPGKKKVAELIKNTKTNKIQLPKDVKVKNTSTGIKGVRRQVILKGGEEIGEVVYSIDDGYVYIDNIQIDDQFQKQGIGTSVIQKILNKEKAKLEPSSNLTEAGQRLQNKFLDPKLSKKGRANNKSISTFEKTTYLHGTPDPDRLIKEGFNIDNSGKTSGYGGIMGKGIYLDTDPSGELARQYGTPVEVNIKKDLNLFDWDGSIDAFYAKSETGHGDPELITKYMQKQGYDGIRGNGQMVIFDPKNLQVKGKSVIKGTDELIKNTVGAQRPKPAQQVISEQSARPKDINAAIRDGSINANEASALRGQVDDLISKSKKRGFTKTIEESFGTPKKIRETIAQNPEANYNAITNDETIARVKKEIIKKGEDYALSIAKNSDNPDANATAVLLMDKYIKKGEFEKFNQLVKEVNPRFTQQGQQIQILSMYGKLTPTGAVRYAQKVVDEANKLLPKNRQIELKPESMKEITALAKEIGKYKEGSREYIVAVAKMLDRIAAESPPSLGQKIATIQTMAQLLNPKTIIRNTVGNLGFSAIENAKDVVATGVDKAVSTITGQRTKVMPDLITQAKGFKKGFQLGLEDALQGIDTSGGLKTQLDLPNRTFREGFLGGAEKALNISLRATDRAAYTAAFDESVRQQMSAAGLTEATDDILKTAHADALYRTFQDDSKLAQIFSGVKRILNKIGTPDGKFGFGDIVLKYPKTPANLLARGVDYSPAGFLKSAYEIYKPLVTGSEFQQKAFVENLSRALTGSSIVGLGYVLGKLGVVTGKPEKDYDIRSTQRMAGQGGFKFNVDAFKRWFASGFNSGQAKPQDGDTLVSYDWFQPQSFTFSMGVNAAKGAKDAKDYMSSLAEGLNSGVQTLAEQPLVTGVTRLASTANLKGAASAFLESLASTPAGFVPSLLNQVGQLTDNTSREVYNPSLLTEELINRTKARIPGLRNTLPERKDVFGQTQETYQDGSNNIFNVFFNPAYVTKFKANPEAKEVLDIFERSGETQQAPRNVSKSIKINGEQKKLSTEEYQAYQTYVGQKTQLAFQELMLQPKWDTLSDEDKAKEMSRVMTDINTAAKIELFGQEQGKSTSKNAKRIVAGTLYKSGKVEVKGATTDDLTGSGKVFEQDTQRLIDTFELNKYVDNTATGLEKFKIEKGKATEATKIFEGSGDYEGLSDREKQSLIEAMGYTTDDTQYDSMAKESTDVKVQYLLEQANTGVLDHATLLQALANGRKPSISGSLFASNSVLDDLEDEGLISAAEKKALKSISYNKSGERVQSGSGSSSAKKRSAAMTALGKELQKGVKLGSVDALIKESKTSQTSAIKVPKYTPDVTLSSENAKNAVPIKISSLVTKAKKPSGVSKARAIIDRVRGGGSAGNAAYTPNKLSRSYYRPSLQ